MRIVHDFPHSVRVIENTWIPLSDGTQLAAKLWLPEGSESEPVPAIFEFLPYRKGDGTAKRDEIVYQYLAGNGYAGVRVDLRGHGESEGIQIDEYTLQEQLDGVECIAWIAEQPWCTGVVGMTGISWGGFNSLQVAAHRPPALKAIITLCSTDDRYADDVHYKGGVVLANDMLHWATYMLMANAEPPDPAIVGERWREMWLERIEANEPLVVPWLEHQRRDEYWKHGSVCENYADIECAVYAVGGWQDGYTNAVLRLLEGLPGPRMGLIGPWGHAWPHNVSPGPTIGFLQETLRWWDHWLKGVDTGIMQEPMLRAWVQDSVQPAPTHLTRPGRFVSAEQWPAPFVERRRFALNDGSIDEAPAGPVERRIRGLQTCGLEAGAWCGEGETADDPDDQRAEDGMSLCFDSTPLDDDLHILGFPKVTLELAADRPSAAVSVRLCEVLPDGASLLVARQVLNLTHRASHEHPQALAPGERVTVAVQLDAIGHRFKAGSRLRVAVSPTYWTWVWPSPEHVTLSVFTGGESALELPVIPADAGDRGTPFLEAEGGPPLEYELRNPGRSGRWLEKDARTRRSELSYLWDSDGDTLYPHGMRVKFDNLATYSIVEGEPLSAVVRCFHGILYAREDRDWSVRVEAHSEMTCDRDSFVVTNRFEAYEGERLVRSREWDHRIPRDLG